MKSVVAYFVGIVFALGLGVGGMTQTHIVRGFLDFFGNWNPALLGVIGGAVFTHGLLFFFIKRRESPLLDTKFHLPTRQDVDIKLLGGSAIFGLGWGWGGICPGPGVVGLVSGDMRFLWFITSMLVGMAIYKLFEKRI